MLIDKVKKVIEEENLIEPKDKIVVGVSGGPDSICLLHILKRLKKQGLVFEICVAHINHMIRPKSILDEEYVENYCKKNNIPVFIKRVKVENIAKQERMGTEEAGRKVRYDYFNEIMHKTKSNKIATAHNANDNAETILLNIIRGTGITGLKGIEIKNNNIIRPLINISRDEIEKYCIENKLNPCRDESNVELIYQRNKIRNVVIPYVEKEFNPNFVKTVNRLSQIAKEESKYIEKQTQNAYIEVLKNEYENKIILDLRKFNLLEKVIKKSIVRYTIDRILGNTLGIQNINIEDIITLCKRNIGNKFLTPNKKIKISIKNKSIVFEKI